MTDDRELVFYQMLEREACALTYLLGDAATRSALIIDPVLQTVERDLQLVRDLELSLHYILETHLHADHITGAGKLRSATGAEIAVSRASGIRGADLLLEDRSVLALGRHELVALATPGHTDGCMSYYIAGMVFTGDCLLIRGTGRTDLQQGNAGTLYDSIQGKLWSLPPETKVYPAHDYRGHLHSTIQLEKQLNPRLGGARSRTEFTGLMMQLKLVPPAKMHQAIAANLLCGMPCDENDCGHAAGMSTAPLRHDGDHS